MELKRRRYAEAGIDASVKLIAGNYVTDGLIDLLRSNGFDFEAPTHLIWEGNIMYMPSAAGKETMLQLRRNLKTFQLSFDYLTESVIRKTTGDTDIAILVESFEAMRAPWLSGIDDIYHLASELGLYVMENFATGELYQKYRGRPAPSAVFQHYSVCTLAS